jgi:hypothetical protein
MIDTETRRGPKIKGAASSAESEIMFACSQASQCPSLATGLVTSSPTYLHPHFKAPDLSFFYQNPTLFR